ncbi:hypothetical protein [Capillibacterium thermochitinicola]|uniref:Uncharacterized protein n=1 Tax=Capillibacterium thermochitinicola TaxID=2699427 RepID=A0A8J6I338_9FIRM|nr:hypothetical protein [Capillibacterium thermochitinicola]MBA2133372.1 hypothetical protein [Capillibacterium thermochitinicola]
MNEGRKQKGSAELMVVWVIMMITALLFATESLLEVKRVAGQQFLKEEELRRGGDEVFSLVLHWLHTVDGAYDTPAERVFPEERLAEAGYPGATVELWDEGSRFNPNNATKALLDEYFAATPRLRQAVTEELFGWAAGPTETLARKNYFLTKSELKALGKTAVEDALLDQCTIYGPAAFHLLDGEVFLSLLYRAGLDLTITAEERIINNFNEKRSTFVNTTDVARLLAALQLEFLPSPEEMGELVTGEGIVNPNYASRHYVETVLSWLFGRVELYDFEEYRVANPFTNRESFVNYLRMVYNREIDAEKVWLCFNLKTRIWGVRIILPEEEGGKELQISAVLERIPGRDRSDFFFKVLSYQSVIVRSE